MTPKMRKKILDLMKIHQLMTIATVRPDGYPQATTVTCANDGLNLYFSCDGASQTVRNIGRNRKVSLAIDRDSEDWNPIRGRSLGGTAQVVKDRQEFQRALRLMTKKYPQMAELGEEDMKGMAIVKVTPKVFSVLDYARGFGHTDLVRA
ncbi:MAG TPA: pyridoxamine 5'-phosphate oxidase family protein [Burkholderiales bacterium]|nr:pyridoxamine 5'-phosphate oxidase family protein [Burkholderiales bacterium]